MPLIRSIVKGRWGYFFIGPAYVLFTIFTIYPLFEGIRLSFYDAGLKMRDVGWFRKLRSAAYGQRFPARLPEHPCILWSSSFRLSWCSLFCLPS